MNPAYDNFHGIDRLVAQTAAYWGNRLPAPGVFGRNPIEEAIGIFLYMILPAVVGVLVTRIASYIWASRVRPQTLVRSAWTASVAVGVLVSAACWLVTLSAYLIYTQSTRNVATFFINVTLAAILVVPAVLMFGLNLVVYLVCQNLNVKPIVLNFLVYAGSSLSLVLQYLWLREGLSH